MIVLDTSGLLAALVADQRRHEDARATLEADPGPFVLSPFVLAELDYLLLREGGQNAELALLSEVAAGSYELARFDEDDVASARDLVERYRDLEIGLAGASIAVLAERYETDRVLTLDERHFRALRTSGGNAFTLLP